MGVYINMEMPKNCDECPLNSTCSYSLHMPLYHTEIRHDDCPLIEVPDPHGDLIDRDAARESIKPWSPEDERNGCTLDTVKKLMHTMLNRAPIIIPASEEG